MCFIGHGSFGIITKAVWCNYFAVFGIGHDLAYRLMPILGAVDILLGISLLVYPTRAIFAWLVGWGIITALLRPLSHEPFAEFIERAGNFGAPLALLLLSGRAKTFSDWFKRISPDNLFYLDQSTRPTYGTPGSPRPTSGPQSAPLDTANIARVILCLRIIVFLLLAGHGWLNLIEKKGLLAQYQSLGFADPARTALIAGCFEILAAVAILVRPVAAVLMALLVWKMGTELFYPHWELFEWVERAGSYGSILALWFAIRSAYHWAPGKSNGSTHAPAS